MARDGVMAVAEKSIGVVEKGANTHPLIKTFWELINPSYYASRPPYCAAYVYDSFRRSGLKPAVAAPALAMAWYREPLVVWRYNPHGNTRRQTEPPKAAVALYKIGSAGRISHAGLLARTRKRGETDFETLEANTSPRGAIGPNGQLGTIDRDGDGIYRKRRSPRSVYVFVDWIPTCIPLAK